MTRAALLLVSALGAAAFACKKKQEPPPPLQLARGGEECALGGRTTHVCPTGMRCAPRAASVPAASVAPGMRPPNAEGHPCGGVAGFVCADGLGCDMPDDQQHLADGMGVCARLSVCTR